MKASVHVASLEGANDKLVTSKKEIKVHFNYPLTTADTFTFKNSRGFTLRYFAKAVRKGYRAIYKEPDKYGIWGHCMGDLYIEGITEELPGMFNLSIGS